ncbi:MAG: hypothetical protein ACOVOE_15685 [Caulobacter sp.]
MNKMPVISSNKYHPVDTLKRVRRRDWIYVGVNRNSPWMVIPQQYSHVMRRSGEHCLLRDGALVCHLHETIGYDNLPVLIGRDAVGRDWLVARNREQRWMLFTRGGGSAASPVLPDSSLSGPTSATGVERLVAAALVIAGVAFDTAEGVYGRPDFIVPNRRLAIFANGCHLHAHGCGFARGYGKKLTCEESNHIRDYDRRVLSTLKSHGWRTLTVWECATISKDRGHEDLPGRLRKAISSSAPSITLEGT